MRRNNRGTALLEAIGAILALSTCLSGLLAVCYLLFAHAWIQFQSEQTLYCLAEATPAFQCRSHLAKNLEHYLPYGEVRNLTVLVDDGHWIVRLQWRTGWTWPSYVMNVRKQLNVKTIAKNSKDLHS